MAFLLLLLIPVCSFGYDVEQVPNVHLKDKRQFVSDPDNILSQSARDSINVMAMRLEMTTGIETAVVMLPTIGDADIFDFSHNLFRRWGIGKKNRDNGFLVVFVMDQHKVRFTTGYGIEGIMTDAMSKRIQMQQMVPRFKQGDWDGGMVAGVKMSAKVLDGSMQPEADSDEDDGMLGAILVLVSIVVVTMFVIYLMGEQQRCPNCHKKGALQKVDSKIMRVAGGRHGRKVRRTTYICKHCGHIVTKDQDVDDSGNALTNAAILGSMLGSGRGGGGGSFGGSFGGGSTGGGGSTSGW